MLQQSYHQALIEQGIAATPDRHQMRSRSVRDAESPKNIATTEFDANTIELGSPDIFGAIDRLEERILNSPRVPLTGKTMVDEEVLLEQLDAMRLSLPEVVTTAREVLEYKHQIVREAQQQAQHILDEANRCAVQVSNELGIVERAEQEARQIRQQALAECEQLRQQALDDIQQLHDCQTRELGLMRQEVTAQCHQIQVGADEYADRVLHNMEYQLKDMLQSIQRGRQYLTQDANTLRIVTPPSDLEVASLSDRLKEIGDSRRIGSIPSSPSVGDNK
jgi:vacuolar-type H+-ATPase subunit H